MKKFIAMLLAVVMVLAMAACEPAEPTPTNPPETTAPPVETTAAPVASYTEAPSITALGTYGDVKDRLPVEDDIFVSTVDATGAALAIGTYGGEINVISGGGSWDISRPTLETIIRRDTDGSYYPNVIKDYKYNDTYTEWTFYLREGMKWSDGDDFNADDITFWYYMCHLTNYSTKKSWAALKDGSLKVFDTTKFTVGGETITSTFATDTDGDFVYDADEAIIDGAYAESYYQSAPSFALRIDGITELN